jgi:hypothetical protein
VLRLIDDGPIGIGVMVLSGRRRQRIGDLLAGTTVGPAHAPVPTPASSPLLVVYPAGWLVAAAVWFLAGSGVREEEAYRSAAQSICERTAVAGATQMSIAEWMPFLEAQYAEHAALRAPDSLRSLHAELLAVERQDLELGCRLELAVQRRDRGAAARLGRQGLRLDERRAALADAGLPACA